MKQKEELLVLNNLLPPKYRIKNTNLTDEEFLDQLEASMVRYRDDNWQKDIDLLC